jgi:hypothetical protein
LGRGRPRFPPDVACPAVLTQAGHPPPSLSPTGLSPPTVIRSSDLRLDWRGQARRLPPPPPAPSNPRHASPAGCAAPLVWALPRSLAATEGLLLPPRGTEMFQFPRFPPRSRKQGARPCAGRVAPFGDLRLTGCQRLPGAFRRVAASFLGPWRLGIHRALFVRITRLAQCKSKPQSVIPITPDRRAPAGRPRLATPNRSDPAKQRTGQNTFNTLSMLRAVRVGEETRAAARLRLTHGRETQRVPRGALSRYCWE